MEQDYHVLLVGKNFLHKSRGKVIINASAERQIGLSFINGVMSSVEIEFVRLVIKDT